MKEIKTKLLITYLFGIAFFIHIFTISNNAKSEALPIERRASVQLRGSEMLKKTKILGINTETSSDFSKIKAESALIYLENSGTVIFEKNSSKKLQIGSLTKLLTGLVVYTEADLNSQKQILIEDTLNVKPILGLKPGEQIKISDLFSSMVVGSANDAALALANYVSQEKKHKFTDLMNKTAYDIGMENSHFSNPVGFDSAENFSTAWDLKILTEKTQKLSAFRNLAKFKTYEFVSVTKEKHKIFASNTLINSNPEIQSIKTGKTPGSGENIICRFMLSNQPVVVIILNSPDRESDVIFTIKELKKQVF